MSDVRPVWKAGPASTGVTALAQDRREEVLAALERVRPRLVEIADWIWAHPELGNQEYQAATVLVEEVRRHGFAVRTGLAGLPTSFEAQRTLGRGGLHLGFLAEYDALPSLGHACGHNLIAASSLGAALALAEMRPAPDLDVYVYGTPAEETTGGKVDMADAGLFDHLDAVMICHPGFRNSIGGTSLATHPIQIEFHGQSAHAAASPEQGVNALEALLFTFNGLKALKQHLRDDARLPGIVVKGGTAPNIVPDYACGQFSVRAADVAYLEEVLAKVQAVADAAAMATGTTVRYHHYENLYCEMRNNMALAGAFKTALESLGEPVSILPPDQRGGSTDVGNVSYRAPTIHPHVSIGAETLRGHTAEFAEAAGGPGGHRGMLNAAAAMALTCLELAADPALLARVRSEFQSARGVRS